MSGRLLDATAVRLASEVATAQADGRLPSLVAGVLRDGELAWTGARGTAVRDGSSERPTPDTQYRVGSITKTFTAALVMQLYEQGRLDLSDQVVRHVPDAPLGDATLRALLSHGSGLPAEPAGPWWERSRGGDWDALARANREVTRVLPAGQRYHYSNLAYGVLGRVVEQLCGCSWADAVAARLTGPAGLGRTTYGPADPYAHGYSVEDTTGLLCREPLQDTGAMAPAGQLWSTVEDLVRWMHLFVEPDPRVLTAAAVQQMVTPQSADPDEGLAGAYGLGLRICGPGPLVLVGHTGSMPGFLAGMFMDRSSGVGAVVLCNDAYGLEVEALPRAMVQTVLQHEPPLVAEWSPTVSVDAATREILGTWYWGNAPHQMSYDSGVLTLRGRGAVVFEPSGRDTWVGRSGYHYGERLRVVRHPDGSPSHLDIGTFCYTRVPYDPAAPIPGAGD